MQVDIHYCSQWSYKPKAASVADEISKAYDAEVTLVPGSGGVFDVIADGKLVYSKAKTGRFPEPGEVVGNIKE